MMVLKPFFFCAKLIKSAVNKTEKDERTGLALTGHNILWESLERESPSS